jgi:hypothetical protein
VSDVFWHCPLYPWGKNFQYPLIKRWVGPPKLVWIWDLKVPNTNINSIVRAPSANIVSFIWQPSIQNAPKTSHDPEQINLKLATWCNIP